MRAADQIQLIARETRVPANSMLFTYLQNNLTNIGSNHVKSVMLLTLESILQYSDAKSREIIAGKVFDVLKVTALEQPDERPGILAQNIVNEFYPGEADYEAIEAEYLESLTASSGSTQHLREILVQRFPEKKIELRGKLLEKLSKANDDLSKRIEHEFVSLY